MSNVKTQVLHLYLYVIFCVLHHYTDIIYDRTQARAFTILVLLKKWETDVLRGFKRLEGLIFDRFFRHKIQKCNFFCALMHRFLCINDWSIGFLTGYQFYFSAKKVI